MVEDLIRRARRRFVFNEALRQLAFAGAVSIAGVALILILGTRYLEWWTLSIVAAAGLAIGAWRVYRGVPDQYATAVRLDRSAELSDALSTALYFSRHEPPYTEFRGAQREQAEAAANRVDLEGAVPFAFPRALYAMAALGLLASGLVVLRFSMGHGLDLRPPLTEVFFQDEAARGVAKQKGQAIDPAQRKRMETAESLLAKLPANPEDQKQRDAMDRAIDQALENPGNSADKGQKGAAGKSEDGKAGNALEQPPEGDPLDGKQANNADGNDQNKAGQKGQAGDKGNSKNGAGDNSSLLSKLKDAVSNMFSKANQDKSNSQKSQPQPGQTAKSEKGSSDKGNASKGQEGQNQSDAQDGEPDGDAEEGQQAQGKAGDKSSQQSAQAGSGVGSQDGAKDLKAAEQLKAMGKISEIIGKRAATVSGETTIEVQSGNQQLRTAYTNKSAAHGEADSDVNRDEIPVGMQSYVQQYFEQVRKSAVTQKAKATGPTDPAPTP